MRSKCPPGPVATSCLTCRRRRTKCDRGRPACERCARDKQDCLGYDHIREHPSTTSSTWSSRNSVAIREIVSSAQRPSPEGPQSEKRYGRPLGGQRLDEAAEPSLLFSDAPLHIPTPPIFNFNTTNDACDADSDALVGLARMTKIHVSGSEPLLSMDNQSQSADGSPANYVSRGKTAQEQGTIFASNKMYPGSACLRVSVPKALSMLSPSSEKLVGFILSQYERISSIKYPTPKRQHAIHMRNYLVDRLQGSSIARCVLFINAKVFESRLDGTSSNHHGNFYKSIEQLEQKLLLVPAASSLRDLQDHLSGTLEVAFLKMQLLYTPQLLSNTATIFLQIVYSDPTLWLNPHGPPSVSLNRIFSSTRYELGRFAILDITRAMAYGIPPPEFLFCIAEINRRYSNGYIAHDWHLVEQRICSFEVHPSDAQDVEPWVGIARFAIVESWRQTLLIYLYMAICGVGSDDDRVQSAVHQLFKLFKLVRKQQPPRADMHSVFQCLLAGACTRNEKQRAYVRERLLESYNNKLWLLPGSQFVPVLDHLWHGGAANGKPIKWSDYIFSRQEALPLSL